MSWSLKVFVSSTSRDLEQYRAATRDVILEQGWQPIMMEAFGAVAQRTLDACKAKVEESDVVLLLVGLRKGDVPGPEQGGDGVASYTALEFEHALKKGIPVLALQADDALWPSSLSENDQLSRNWVDAFRKRINQPAAYFGHEQDPALPVFRSKITQVLVLHLAKTLKRRVDVDGDLLDVALGALRAGRAIPFLGSEMRCLTPLRSAALKTTIDLRWTLESDSLPAVTEYRERMLGKRNFFLSELRELLSEKQGSVEHCPVYDLLLSVPRPPVIVSMTWDTTLEDTLRKAGHKCTTVCHILRSNNDKDQGKIVVREDGQPPKSYLADCLELPKDSYIIYKPLGSPFFHDIENSGESSETEWDTVVITENDHIGFLRKLEENQHTKIPSKFVRMCQTRIPLFLGYDLDIWHRRFIMSMLKTVATEGSISVRNPSSQMEELAWDQLRVRLLRMDPEEFSGRALSTAVS